MLGLGGFLVEFLHWPVDNPFRPDFREAACPSPRVHRQSTAAVGGDMETKMAAVPALTEEFGVDTEITEDFVQMLDLCLPMGTLRGESVAVKAVKFLGHGATGSRDLRRSSMHLFDHTSSVPSSLTVEEFEDWTKDGMQQELKRQSDEGSLVFYLSRLETIWRELDVQMVLDGTAIVIDESVPFQVLHFDRGECQQDLGLEIVRSGRAE